MVQLDIEDEVIVGRDTTTDLETTRRLFGHVHVEHGTIRRAARQLINGHVGEESQAPNAALRSVNQHSVKRIPLNEPHLPANNTIKGLLVTIDVDLFDIDPRAFVHLEGDINRLGLRVSVQTRVDINERIAVDTRGKCQRLFCVFNPLGIKDSACTDRYTSAKDFARELRKGRVHIDLTEIVFRALFHLNRDDEVLTIRGQLSDC